MEIDQENGRDFTSIVELEGDALLLHTMAGWAICPMYGAIARASEEDGAEPRMNFQL